MDSHDDIHAPLKLEFYDFLLSHKNYIRNFSCLFADTLDEADELRHEIVEKLDRSFPTCRANNARQQWRWAQRVMQTVAIDHLRRRLSRRAVPLTDAMSLPDDAYDRENREILEELIAYLDNDKDREILHLLLEGYEYGEISVMVHLNEDLVRQRVSRALKKMRIIKTKIYG